MEIERGGTRSHTVNIFFFKSLWTFPKTDYGMQEIASSFWEAHLHHFLTSLEIKFALTARTYLVPSVGYRLDHRGIEVCFPGKNRILSVLRNFQTGSRTRPAANHRITLAPSLAVKTPVRESDHPPG
jgi:hypothetical protein